MFCHASGFYPCFRLFKTTVPMMHLCMTSSTNHMYLHVFPPWDTNITAFLPFIPLYKWTFVCLVTLGDMVNMVAYWPVHCIPSYSYWIQSLPCLFEFELFGSSLYLGSCLGIIPLQLSKDIQHTRSKEQARKSVSATARLARFQKGPGKLESRPQVM